MDEGILISAAFWFFKLKIMMMLMKENSFFEDAIILDFSYMWKKKLIQRIDICFYLLALFLQKCNKIT